MVYFSIIMVVYFSIIIYTLPEGVQDMNDAGIILMPDGNHAVIAIFTTHSPSEAVIANIASQLLERIR